MNCCQKLSNASSTKGSNMQAAKVLNIKSGGLKGDVPLVVTLKDKFMSTVIQKNSNLLDPYKFIIY